MNRSVASRMAWDVTTRSRAFLLWVPLGTTMHRRSPNSFSRRVASSSLFLDGSLICISMMPLFLASVKYMETAEREISKVFAIISWVMPWL